MFCIHCGRDNGKDAEFCVSCGKAIKQIDPPVQKPQPPIAPQQPIIPQQPIASQQQFQQQYQPPFQPTYHPPYQPPVQKKKSKVGLFVILGAAALVVVVGMIFGIRFVADKGGVANLFQKNTPQQVTATTPTKDHTPTATDTYQGNNQINGNFTSRDAQGNMILSNYNATYLFDQANNTTNLLIDHPTYYAHYIDGCIYYLEENSSLMRMDLASRNTEQILSSTVDRVRYEGNMLYAYSEPAYEGDGYLYYADLHATDSWQKIYIGSWYPVLAVQDGVLYVMDHFYEEESELTLWSVDIQTKIENKLVSGEIDFLGMHNGQLYYNQYNQGVNETYRMGLDGTNKERIASGNPIFEEGNLTLFFLEDHMYVSNYTYGLYQLSLDATDEQVILYKEDLGGYDIEQIDQQGDDLYLLINDTQTYANAHIVKADMRNKTLQILSDDTQQWETLSGLYDLPSIDAEPTQEEAPTIAPTSEPRATATQKATATPKVTATQKPSTNSSGLPNDYTSFKKPSWFTWEIVDEGDASGSYQDPFFTNGRYVREDGYAVLYLDHDDSPDGYTAGLSVQGETDQTNLKMDRAGFHQDETGYSELYDDNPKGTMVAKVVRKHVIEIITDSTWRANHKGKALPDGYYYLVREKK